MLDPIGGYRGWNPLPYAHVGKVRQKLCKCVENTFSYQTVSNSTSNSLLLGRYERSNFGKNCLKNAFFDNLIVLKGVKRAEILN